MSSDRSTITRARRCPIQQEAIADHEGVLVTPTSMSHFFEDFTTDKFRIARRLELCVFFRRKFGPNWVDKVRQNCGLDGRDFDREFVQFADPCWGFLAVELYAYRLGFESVLENGLRRWQEWVLKQLDVDPFSEPQFDHRKLIRASRSSSTKKRNTAFSVLPELVPIVAAAGRPFDPMMFAPSWLKLVYPHWPAPKALTRGRLRTPRTSKKRKNMPLSEWRNQVLNLLEELVELEKSNPKQVT